MGAVLGLLSMLTGTASFIALIRPLPGLWLPTRGRAFVVWILSFGLFGIAIGLTPTPVERERAVIEPSGNAGEGTNQIGVAIHANGDNTPASSASRVPQTSAVAEPVKGDCADWNSRGFFDSATVEDVVDCLQSGADPQAREVDAGPFRQGWTPLHRAAESTESPEVIEILLDAGADLVARDDSGGDTPLHRAAASNANPAIIAALLDAGSGSSDKE